MDLTPSFSQGLAPIILLMLFVSWGLFVFGGAYLIWLAIRALRRHLRDTDEYSPSHSLHAIADATYYMQKQLYSIWQELNALRASQGKPSLVPPPPDVHSIREQADKEIGNYGRPQSVSNSAFGR